MTLLGCVADDVTGGTDVAAALRRSGLRVLLLFGVPEPEVELPVCDAVVVALKTRTVPAAQAIEETLLVLDRLNALDIQAVYFKYCSTFDSTDEGNIGPVTDALLRRLSEKMTLACPASPEHGRTVYRGHLFVGDVLLSDSSMRSHPLTPMTDPNLVRVLGRQTDGHVDLLRLADVRAGAESVSARLKTLEAAGTRHVVVDATEPEDLAVVAAAARARRVLTGGAGLAGALGTVLGERSRSEAADTPPSPADSPLPDGPAIVLAGSCSVTTLGQVSAARDAMPSYRLDPAMTPDSAVMLSEARDWLHRTWGSGPVLVYSSATPAEQVAARQAMGEQTADILERTLGLLARDAAALGAARFVVAGGETSGAVIKALGVRSVVVAEEADRGVPWCLTTDDPPRAVLLKSGNFGTEDLLVRAVGRVLR